MRRRSIVLCACGLAALLASCGGPGGQGFTPRHGEHVSVSRAASPSGTLSDLASQVSIDTLLHNKGARLVKAEPFAPCPGEAGEQTFTLRTAGGPGILHVAFTQWNGTTTIASYRRPAKAPDDPAAMDVLRRSVCSS